MIFRLKFTILLLLLFIVQPTASPHPLNTEEKNYCEDSDTNMQWEALIKEHPDDLQVHALYALRLGLCFEDDRGDLAVDQATEIFENIRSALINARGRD